MANTAKAAGTRFEREVVEYLRAAGWKDADRRPLAGANDKGDVKGVSRWSLELKAHKPGAPVVLAQAVDEAQREFAKDDETAFFAAVVKRARASVAEAYVVMPLWQWALIAGMLEIAE